MAKYIIIGTDNIIEPVIDEINKSHQSPHYISKGCIIKDGDGHLLYRWTQQIANTDPVAATDNLEERTTLNNCLSNQIAHFQHILKTHEPLKIILISPLMSKEDTYKLEMMFNGLRDIAGNHLINISLDVLLLGFDLDRSGDVTRRPDWKLCRDVYKKAMAFGHYDCKIAYVNNINIKGAAVNLNKKLLVRLIKDFSLSKSCETATERGATKKFYAIGMAEYHYDFSELIEFFTLAATERLLDRKIFDEPNSSTKSKIEAHTTFDFHASYTDGLQHIIDAWQPYAGTKFDYSKTIEDNGYTLAAQKAEIGEALWHIIEPFIERLNNQLPQLKNQEKTLKEEIHILESDHESDNAEENRTLEDKKAELEHLKAKIKDFSRLIEVLSFPSAEAIRTSIVSTPVMTSADKQDLESQKERHSKKIDFFLTEEGKSVLKKVLDFYKDEVPAKNTPSESTLKNVGLKTPKITEPSEPPTPATSQHPDEKDNGIKSSSPNIDEELKTRKGCLLGKFWPFNKNIAIQPSDSQKEEDEKDASEKPTPTISKNQVGKWIEALKKLKETEEWFKNLLDYTNKEKTRKADCKIKMDGQPASNHQPAIAGYKIYECIHSKTLIDMARVREFRDNNSEFLSLIEEIKREFFNESIEAHGESESQIIERLIIRYLQDKYGHLKWDGKNPFVKEQMSDHEIGEIIRYTFTHSNPYVESQRLANRRLVVNLYSNSYILDRSHTDFTHDFNVDVSINPRHTPDFIDTICMIQTSVEVNAPIDIVDFVPHRDTYIHDCNLDYTEIANPLISQSETKRDKAKALYDWVCENITYDTTYTIYDADRCYKNRSGVCQAYCELFARLAETHNLVVEIITGYSKLPNGTVPEVKHSWLYVYTDGYDGIFIDPTWGAGTVNDGVFTKSTDTSPWFDIKPSWLIYTHFPDKNDWIKVDLGVTEEEFSKLPFRMPGDGDIDSRLREDLYKLRH